MGNFDLKNMAAAYKAAAQQAFEKSLKEADIIPCEECENTTYNSVVVVKRISSLASPTGEEMIVPVQTFQCTSCNHINKKFDV